MIATTTYEVKNFTAADEVRTFPNGRLELVHIGENVIGKITLQPGWCWSTDVKPIAKTEWCEAPHFQYIISGRMHISTLDGHEFDVKAGDVVRLPSGHNAWVVGNEPLVAVDWAGMTEYAQK